MSFDALGESPLTRHHPETDYGRRCKKFLDSLDEKTRQTRLESERWNRGTTPESRAATTTETTRRGELGFLTDMVSASKLSGLRYAVD